MSRVQKTGTRSIKIQTRLAVIRHYKTNKKHKTENKHNPPFFNLRRAFDLLKQVVQIVQTVCLHQNSMKTTRSSKQK